MTALKILVTVLAILLLFLPLLPLPKKLRRFSTFYGLRYDAPNNRLNAVFVLLTIVEFVVLAIIYGVIFNIASGIASIPFIARLLAKVSPSLAFDSTVLFRVLLLNLVTLYTLLFLKGVVKGALGVLLGFRKKKPKKKKKSTEEEEAPAEEDASAKKPHRVSVFFRARRKKAEEKAQIIDEEEKALAARKTHAEDEKFKKNHPFLYRVYMGCWGLFFEKPDLKHSRRFVHAATAVVQFFICVVEAIYALLFFLLLLGVFFPMPNIVYVILNWTTTKIYIYPFISLIFLQELCNTFKAPCKPPASTKKVIEIAEKEEEEQKKIGLDKLRCDILRRFAKYHSIRYFPATESKEVEEYRCTNEIYKDALNHISLYMKNNYGRVIQSYMGGLDAVFNDRHVYFGSSFYSQLGEYIIAYTYMRLLSGQRIVFIVSDRSKVVGLQQYIGNRLTEITGVTRDETWRVYSADAHHLNEADVLVGVPEDFAADNLVENYPGFFEEACNAVFVDADKILNLNSYLCAIMACRLKEATGGKIRFMFLSRDVLQGFSASLRKFFCIDEEIVDCNSAEENENVSYMLWNRESNVLYNKDGQSETTIESLIAELAYSAHVDGIRILTSVPLSPAEKQNFQAHDVEINRFHKEVPRVNYMICTDDRCNLAAAIYAFTRFHGKEASILHILSRPYLLREYFGDRVEMYVNQSDLIKPRATEHADTDKILLLRLLCEATADISGMPISRFVERIDAAMKEKGMMPAAKHDLNARVAFLLSELMFKPDMIAEKRETKSDGTVVACTVAGKPVYNYYSIIQPDKADGYELHSEMHISFLRMEEVFGSLLENNRRVELSMHGTVIGALDTFPDRVYQQYLPGQYIIYDNHEYEIEKIAADRKTIYLRQENITNNSCLDTAFLRRYTISDRTDTGALHGVHHYSTGALAEIDVGYERAKILGETYGFYRLMANSQTLNFKEGVGGNPNLDERTVAEQARRLNAGKILTVRLVSREKCTDGTRKLLAAVLNEFLRTMFPETYRCVAVCPVLLSPIAKKSVDESYEGCVETLYPYIVDSEAAKDENTAEFLIINDAEEDVGVVDRLYDGGARIMEELFSYIYDYLKWLAGHPTLPAGDAHYIYFGADSLPSVYDLEGSVALLANCERKIGEEKTADAVEKPTHCSFCKHPLVTGRYAIYDDHRYICFDCQVEAVSEDKDLARVVEEVKSYWAEHFPDRELPKNVNFALADPFSLEEGQELSEYFYRLAYEDRRVEIECDLPHDCVFVAVLRGFLSTWHRDESCVTTAAVAQLYYEELCYLDSIAATERAEFTRKAIEDSWMSLVEDIKRYVTENAGRTSFDYVVESAVLPEPEDLLPTPSDDDGEGGGNEGLDALYDPDRVPRFWKRYLRGKRASDDDSNDGRIPADETEDVGDTGADDSDTSSASDGMPRTADTAEEKEKSGKLANLKTGKELIPHEPEEDRNPQIRLYNEIARHISDFSDEAIPCFDMPIATVRRIFYFVLYDYPEFFWVENFRYSHVGDNVKSLMLCFRCLGADGKVDVARVQKHRKELRAHVKFFTKGITRKTDPYEAMLTIYRRLILNLDYDGVGLDNGAGQNVREEDTLRSLHSALVDHKVVCVGYAVAAQYLLQSVGICCGQVVSKTHAWNVVKLGKYCYYLDVTWGDPSNTKRGDADQNVVGYGYFCVTAKENLLGEDRAVREPDPELFGDLEEFRATKHEYCRFHGGYLTSYNEEQIAKVFAKAVSERPFEKAAPCAVFRCADKNVYDMVVRYLWTDGGIHTVKEKARAMVAKDGKNKQANKLLDRNVQLWPNSRNLTLQFLFPED